MKNALGQVSNKENQKKTSSYQRVYTHQEGHIITGELVVMATISALSLVVGLFCCLVISY
jgi:hypothetical protein